MANIYDYLAFRGDLTLAERPFNDVDNLILSALSYLDFTDIVCGPGDCAEDEPQGIELSERSRKLVNDLLGTFAHKSAGEAKKATRDTLDQLRQGAKDVASTAVSRLRQNKEE